MITLGRSLAHETDAASVTADQLNAVWSAPSYRMDPGTYATKMLGWTSFADMGLNTTGNPHSSGVSGSDMWGWKDPNNGKMVVAMATTCNINMIDVTDPTHHLVRASFNTPCTDTHDVKIHNGIAYVTSDNRPNKTGYENFETEAQTYGAVQRFDVRSSVMTELNPIRIVGRATNAVHNFAINPDTNTLYLGTMRPYAWAGTEVIDISVEPPVFVARLGSENQYRNFHDMHVLSPTTGTYAGKEIVVGAVTSGAPLLSVSSDLSNNDAAHAYDGVVLWDVTDKTNPPIELLFARYSDKARFSHQVWATDDLSYVYVNDEGLYGFWIPDEYKDAEGAMVTESVGFVIDVRDPTHVHAANFSTGIPTKNHNMYVRGDKLYWSNYQSGVLVYDIKTPMEPRLIARFDPDATGDNGWGGSWTNYPFFDYNGSPFVVNADRYFGLQTFELELCKDVRATFKDRRCCGASEEPSLLATPALTLSHTH